VNWLAQDKDNWQVLVHTVRQFRIPYNLGRFLPNSSFISILRRTPLRGGIFNVSESLCL